MREARRALGALVLAGAAALANPSAADELDGAREALLRGGFETVPGLAVGAFDADGTSIGYRTMGSGPPMLLIHGFPETGRAWAHVAERLAAEHALIVPDYRGACASDVPAGGYDKATMAEDLHALVASLGHESVHVVGHDIGMMVAFAYAARRPEAVRTLALVEGILPGTRAFDDVVASGAVWHFGLQENVDFAVELISGRPRVYFDHFWFGPVVGQDTPIGDGALAQYRDCHDSPDEIRGGRLALLDVRGGRRGEREGDRVRRARRADAARRRRGFGRGTDAGYRDRAAGLDPGRDRAGSGTLHRRGGPRRARRAAARARGGRGRAKALSARPATRAPRPGVCRACENGGRRAPARGRRRLARAALAVVVLARAGGTGADLTSATTLGEGGLRIGTDERNVLLFPYLQLEAAARRTDGDGAPSADDDDADVDADVRRARVYAIAKAGRFGAALVPDFAPPGDPVLVAAYVDWTPRERVTLRLGQQLPPFSLSKLTSSRFLTFAERAPVATLWPDIAFGLAGSVSGRVADAARGWVVGGGLYGGSVHEGVGDAGLALALHASVGRDTEAGRAWHVGLGLLGRDLDGAGDAPALSAGPPSAFPAGLDAAAGALDDARGLVGANLELAAVRGPVSIQTELTALVVDRPGRAGPVPVGGYVFATWTLTGESRSYRAESSDFARLEVASPVGASGGRGAWELGLRIGALDLDGAAGDGPDRQSSASVVLNWYATRRARTLLELGSLRLHDAPSGVPERERTATLRLHYAF